MAVLHSDAADALEDYQKNTQKNDSQKAYIEKFTGFGVRLKNYLINTLLDFYDFVFFLSGVHFGIGIFLVMNNLYKIIIYLISGNCI